MSSLETGRQIEKNFNSVHDTMVYGSGFTWRETVKLFITLVQLDGLDQATEPALSTLDFWSCIPKIEFSW